MILAKPWSGESLNGEWDLTFKVDGVRAIRKGDTYVSRSGKPLYNLDHLPSIYQDVEVYTGSWEGSVSAVRTKDSEPVPEDHVFDLKDATRLYFRQALNPTKEKIEEWLVYATGYGFEGLVLRQGNTWLKVKPSETYDVPITQLIPGKGKHTGRVGAVLTPMGKVGTGMSDKDREELLTTPIGTIIEVECMSLTPSGKFRHPRLKRIRWDKS